NFAALHESAFGPKRTSLVAPHMSAFGGKADMTIAACLLLRSLLGVKRTWLIATHMSASDPKRTLRQFGTFQRSGLRLRCPCSQPRRREMVPCAGEISSIL